MTLAVGRVREVPSYMFQQVVCWHWNNDGPACFATTCATVVAVSMVAPASTATMVWRRGVADLLARDPRWKNVFVNMFSLVTPLLLRKK